VPGALWAVAMLLLAGTITFSALNGSFSTDTWFIPLAITMILGYSTVGALLASRNPRNPIGWLLMSIGVAFLLGGFTEEYATYTYVTSPGSLPAGLPVAWVTNWIYAAMFAVLPFLGLLFPTGRVPGPRWRFLVPVTIAFGAVAVIGTILSPGPMPDAPIPLENPTGVEAFGVAPLVAVVVIAWFGLIAAQIASILAVVVRYRRSVGEERQQIRWLAYVALMIAAVLLVAAAGALVLGDAFVNSIPGQLFLIAGFTLVGIGVPVAMGVAILKYRLYDLDVVIKKTVVFAILVTMIMAVGGFGGLAVGGSIVGRTNQRPGLTLLAGVLFGLLLLPLYRLSKRIADRVVYGGRAKPYEVMTEFSGRMAESYSTDDVLPRMAQILAEGTGAQAARVWLRVGDELRAAGGWPGDGVGATLRMDGDELPALSDRETAFEVRHQGELLGAVSVTMPASDPMNPGRDKLVRDLASQAGLVLRNVRLIEEVRDSRRRLVTAQDAERRRLERNIHDGAQQQLVALSVKLRLVDQLVDRDAIKAHEMLTQLQAQTNEALEDLRDLARGIYPPLLADQGLPAAIEAQARKSAMAVKVDPNGIGRFPQEVEAAVYFCVLEALQNVAKYAKAEEVAIRLDREGERLVFEVRDDGVGFDPITAPRGTGLHGMADRVEAIGGEFEIRSSPGTGTTVTGRVPVAISARSG
jgi:signal transduction histidine kinase